MTDEPPDISGDPKEQERKDVEAAFLNSGNHSINGTKLHGYSIARKMAAQAMGLLYGEVDEAGRQRFTEGKVYPGAMRDVSIVLWLCSLGTEDEVEAASRAPRKAALKAMEWGGKQGFDDLGDSRFWNGFVVMLAIMKEVNDSRVIPEKKTGPDVPVPTLVQTI